MDQVEGEDEHVLAFHTRTFYLFSPRLLTLIFFHIWTKINKFCLLKKCFKMFIFIFHHFLFFTQQPVVFHTQMKSKLVNRQPQNSVTILPLITGCRLFLFGDRNTGWEWQTCAEHRHAVAGRRWLQPPAPTSPSGANKPSPISAFDWLPGQLIFDGIMLITPSLIYNLMT